VAEEEALTMRHTHPAAILNCELLRFVRDRRPTEAEFLAWLGGPADAGIYYVLRKAGLVTLRDGRVGLSPRHLSPDGRTFVFGNRRFHLDLDRVDVFAIAHGGPDGLDIRRCGGPGPARESLSGEP
jgi:hypothetical protein